MRRETGSKYKEDPAWMNTGELLEQALIHMVAVGTTIADRPPHRTVRAALPHTAPTLED